MKTILSWCLIAVALLTAACSNETTTLTGPSPTISATDWSSRPSVLQNGAKYALAAKYLADVDLEVFNLIHTQLDQARTGTRPIPVPPQQFNDLTTTPWGPGPAWNDYLAIQGTPAYMLIGMAQGLIYQGVSHTSPGCGFTPTTQNWVFTPQFVQDHRAAIDHLFRLDSRGTNVVTLKTIFDNLEYVSTLETFRSPMAKGLWVASCVATLEQAGGEMDTHQLCVSPECLWDIISGQLSEDEFAMLAASMAAGGAAGLVAFIASAPVLPAVLTGILAYLTVELTADLAEAAYRWYCENYGPCDTAFWQEEMGMIPGSFSSYDWQQEMFFDVSYNPEYYLP